MILHIGFAGFSSPRLVGLFIRRAAARFQVQYINAISPDDARRRQAILIQDEYFSISAIALTASHARAQAAFTSISFLEAFFARRHAARSSFLILIVYVAISLI